MANAIYPKYKQALLTGDTNIDIESGTVKVALVDTVNSRLLAAGSLSAAQGVTAGNSFSLGAFDIGIPGA